jgi:prephenate dehydratase
MARSRQVAYPGDPGAFAEEAAEELFPGDALVPYPTLGAVFHGVEDGRERFGVVPLENSQAGSVNETYDLLAGCEVSIVGEVVVHVDHALMALPGTRLEDVRVVSSHPQALAQCQEFLEPLDVEIVAVYGTSTAARRIAEEGRAGEAAIASPRAAAGYGLEVLARGIQTSTDNRTRFVAISADPSPVGSPDKTSLLFGTRNVPGALHRCLGALARRGLNLSKIESRPLGLEPWQYRFYLDVDAGLQEPALSDAVEELRSEATSVRVLGTYPRWRERGRVTPEASAGPRRR